MLSNPAIHGQVKIGRTQGNVRERARQLTSTGVPQPFDIVFYCLVDDCVALERELHQQLEPCRTTRRKEWFKAEQDEAIRVILNVLKRGHYRVYSVQGPYRRRFVALLVSRRRLRRLAGLLLLILLCSEWLSQRSLGVAGPGNSCPIQCSEMAHAAMKWLDLHYFTLLDATGFCGQYNEAVGHGK